MAVETRMRSRIVMLALGGAALLILAMMVGMRGGWGRSTAKDRQGRLGASATADRDARRTGVQAALREGRFEEAFASFAGRGGGEVGAEDLHALGTALLERDRLVLGWTAPGGAAGSTPVMRRPPGPSTNCKGS